MIKFFQKLKAKKGFTLVELIVVIAIIGVLAAILIPTMLGYVTSSRVQSSNSTAAELKNMVNNFITDMDTRGYTFDRANSHTCTIAKTEDGDLTATFSENAFKSGTIGDIQAALATKITDDFGFNKVSAIVFIKNGKPVGCAYSADGQDLSDTFAEGNFTGETTKTNEFTGWGDTDGVTSDGFIVGTAPQLTKPLNSDGE